MSLDFHEFGKTILIFLVIFTLLSDFGIGILGVGLNLPSLNALNTASGNLQKHLNYTITSFQIPIGYPFDAVQTASTLSNTNWLGGSFIILGVVAQVTVDLFYNILNLVINGFLLLADTLVILYTLVFVIIPGLLTMLNVGILAPFVTVINIAVFAYMGLVAASLIGGFLPQKKG